MKRAIIVHCWSGYPEYCWYPYAKQELEKRGFAVSVPAMPETDAPKLSLWLPELRRIVGAPDADTFLIGHSIGCVTIMRYLESLSEGERIGGAVLVAGYTDDLGFSELGNFFETPLDFEAMKKHCHKFVTIHSDNDPYVPLRHSEILKEQLGATAIIKRKGEKVSGTFLAHRFRFMRAVHYAHSKTLITSAVMSSGFERLCFLSRLTARA